MQTIEERLDRLERLVLAHDDLVRTIEIEPIKERNLGLHPFLREVLEKFKYYLTDSHIFAVLGQLGFNEFDANFAWELRESLEYHANREFGEDENNVY